MTIELKGYAKRDRNGDLYYFIRNHKTELKVDLSEHVIFIHPFQVDGKDKIKIILRPAKELESNDED
jgi:hypothetical protein